LVLAGPIVMGESDGVLSRRFSLFYFLSLDVLFLLNDVLCSHV
jgi:hypothetical protein